MFKHQLQTKTDAMQLFRTWDDLLQLSVNNPDVRIIKGDHDSRTSRTTWLTPQWNDQRRAYCDAKKLDIQKYGSN